MLTLNLSQEFKVKDSDSLNAAEGKVVTAIDDPNADCRSGHG